ncbi:RNA polymerase II-associated protein 3 [Triticum urartu]|uniref:RNA polymerase II-associated protein 3 n=1 Tax=Triticum urartu TaxID=4572 RepID=M7YSM8_TRIUA|nr:RNA polymerase II-associated protein 3 [Triticum urartu]
MPLPYMYETFPELLQPVGSVSDESVKEWKEVKAKMEADSNIDFEKKQSIKLETHKTHDPSVMDPGGKVTQPTTKALRYFVTETFRGKNPATTYRQVFWQQGSTAYRQVHWRYVTYPRQLEQTVAVPLRRTMPPEPLIIAKGSDSEILSNRGQIMNFYAKKMAGRYNRTNYSSYLNDEPMPDATSEKEQGNEYFKQKKFAEAVECYSRILRFYLELNRFEAAENDCTEALNLDDRYVKAYSRRITARKGLGKLKEAMDDAEFAVSVDANNPELRKQYSEIKALLMEKMAKRSSVQAKHTISEFDKAGDRKNITSHAPSDPQKDSFMEVDPPGRAAAGIRELSGGASKGGSGVSLKDNNMQQSRDAKQKPGPEISVQELASRAASRYISNTVKSVKTPKTAYDFEVSWRAISDDLTQQIQLLKSIRPERLPEIFKDALSSAFLIDIVKCTASIFRDDAVLAVSILENLAKVSRFDLIIMCLSPMHKSGMFELAALASIIQWSTTDVPGKSHNAVSGYLDGREIVQSWFGGGNSGPEVADEMGNGAWFSSRRVVLG